MTLKEALDCCKDHKDVFARRPCWDNDRLKNDEAIFWHPKEEAFCYYHMNLKIVPLPIGWDDDPKIGCVVSCIPLSDALADDWISFNLKTGERIYSDGESPDTEYTFAENDQFVGGLINDREEDPWRSARKFFNDFVL